MKRILNDSNILQGIDISELNTFKKYHQPYVLVVTMNVEDFPLDEDEFEVPQEPLPTTTVIPFAKDNIVGRTIHMVYETDGSFSFFKGKVVSHAPTGDEFSVKFCDQDIAKINLVSGNDTILWETRDITRGGRWKEVEQESEVAAESIPAAPAVAAEPSPAAPATQAVISPVRKPVAKKAVVKKQELRTSMHKRKNEGADLKEEERSLKSAKNVARQVAHSSQASLGQKNEPETGDIEKQTGDPSIKDTIGTVGKKFLTLLGDIKQSTIEMNALASRLESFGSTNALKSKSDIDIVKNLRGFLSVALKKPQYNSEKNLSLGRAWPLNDIVLEALGNLHEVALKLCDKANIPRKLEPNDITRWKTEQKNPRKVDEQPGMSTPAKVGQFSSPAAQRSEMKAQKSAKVEWETFASTGNSTRDDAIKIFAHALMSAETPFELAVDIEQALYSKYKVSEDAPENGLSDDYYKSIKGVWDIIHPASAMCHSIVRMMMLGGYLRGKDLISLSAEDCKTKEKAFLDSLQQKL